MILPTPDPKERILDAAAALFAQKGFSSVGVREIAKEAGVNISMISYYYNGKIGVLKAIIEEYFKYLDEIVERIKVEQLPMDQGLRRLISEFVILIRTRTNYCKVAIIELPFNVPEVAEFKVALLDHHINMIKSTFHGQIPTVHDAKQNIVIGPAFVSLIFSHFLLGHLAETSYNVKFDDKFFNYYTETIATLFLNGIVGVAQSSRKGPHKPSHPHGGHPHDQKPSHPHGGHPHD